MVQIIHFKLPIGKDVANCRLPEDTVSPLYFLIQEWLYYTKKYNIRNDSFALYTCSNHNVVID